MTADVVYPSTQVTPAGLYQIFNDLSPMMRLRAFDGSIDTYLMGGWAPPYNDPTVPEAVAICDLDGLWAPWKHITQKGATQDGVTQIDALYDPIDVGMEVECIGRDQKHLRRVVRHLLGSIDAKQQSELSWFTQEMGYWWAPVRWREGSVPNPMPNLGRRRHKLKLKLSADDAFWRSFDDVSPPFQATYDAMTDAFTTNYSRDRNLGPNWPQYYHGEGGGWYTAIRSDALWVDGTPYLGKEVVNGPYDDGTFSETTTNNQVIRIQLGTIPEITFPDGAEAHIWGRMGRNFDGSWNGDGIKLQIGYGELRLSYYIDFVETTMRTQHSPITPFIGDNWTLICGEEGDERMFRVHRNGNLAFAHKETGTASIIDADHRGIGFGVRAGAGLISQATPSRIRNISAGDNSTVVQNGFLECWNIGDQPMPRDYTLFGPGTFNIYDGPGSNEFVTVGPLLANQQVFVRANPQAKTPLIEELTALGTGSTYKLMTGRFSDNSLIPPKSPGRPVQPYHVQVAIDDGNADSKILSAGTPRRRYPL